jgi:hypothetical protein
MIDYSTMTEEQIVPLSHSTIFILFSLLDGSRKKTQKDLKIQDKQEETLIQAQNQYKHIHKRPPRGYNRRRTKRVF